jgi:hypothetical protein
MCGWPLDSHVQIDPDCMFGIFLALANKFEEYERGGKHGHGQGIQPALQAHRLQRMMAEGTILAEHLFGFMESVMMAYWPTPSSFTPPCANVGTHPMQRLTSEIRNVSCQDSSGVCVPGQASGSLPA